MQDTFASSQDSPSNITLREYGDILRRRRAIIFQTFVIVSVVGVLINLYTPLTYSATARLLTEAPRIAINQINTADPLNELFSVNQQYSLLTQVQMLQRSELQQKVADDLNIKTLPLITVKPIEGTQIIEATAEGEDQNLVASVLNKLMQSYIDDVKRNSERRVQNAYDFALSKQEKAREDILEYEEASNQFKQKHSLFELTRNKEELLNRVQSLTDQYQQARTDMQALQARIAATNMALRAQQATIVAFRDKMADPRIQAIDDELVKLDASLKAQGATGFKIEGNSPQVEVIKVQIKRLNERKDELLRTFVQRNSFPNPQIRILADQVANQSVDLASLQTKIVDLQRRLTEAQSRLKNFPNWEHEWANIQGPLAKAHTDFDYYSNQANLLQLRMQNPPTGPTIMEKAVPPTKAIRPNRWQNIAFSTLLGLFFGLCLALLQELFDDRINSPEEAERVLRLPSLGLIPLIEEEGLRLIKDTATFSPLLESYRKLRTNINFAAVGHQVRSLVVTSSVAAEGKSTTVANLAMAMAMENKRVIIVDADLRRPSLHRLFKVDASPGLTDILVGTHSISDVIRPTSVENVSVIPAGSPPPNPAELLGSAEMGRLLASLESMCDIALFDSPPALVVADSVVLAARANGVLLVIGYGETKKTNTRKAIEVLSRANANILGTVLNRMEGSNSGYYYVRYYVPVSETGTPAAANGNAENSPDTPKALTNGEGRVNNEALGSGVAGFSVEDENNEDKK